MSQPEPLLGAWGRLPWFGKAGAALLLAFAALLTVLLLPEWLHNPDLSHGLFMPFVFLFLLHESRTMGPFRYLRGGPGAAAAVALLATAGLGALFAAGLYAAAFGWTHPLAGVFLASAFAAGSTAAVVAFSQEGIRLVPFNWNALSAGALWLLSAPIPPGSYTRLSLRLQLDISSAVLRTLQVLGIAAHRQGNIIELARGTVGIEEACSGVRSLVSCVFAGLFLSACMVRRPAARALIIAVAAPLALAMNFVRSLTLTLLANAGVDIARGWHDATGYAVLIVTAGALFGLARRFEEASIPTAPEPPATAPALGPLRILAGALVIGAVATCAFAFNTRSGGAVSAAPPDLYSLLPGSAQGWSIETRKDLSQFRSTLRTDLLAERTFTRADSSGPVLINFYIAYWRPGQVPASFVAVHTPDGCWPGAGWVPQTLPLDREQLELPGGRTALAESRLFTNEGFKRYVWFWQVYGDKPVPFENPYSVPELLRMSLRFGFRRDAEQLFVRVSSNRPWHEIADEPFLRQFFENLGPYGLAPSAYGLTQRDAIGQ